MSVPVLDDVLFDDRARLYGLSVDALVVVERDVRSVLVQYFPFRSEVFYEHVTFKILDKVYLGVEL